MTDPQFNIHSEIWKAILGYPGYEVSDHGRVRSFLQKVRKTRGYGSDWVPMDTPQRILKQAKHHSGRRAVVLHGKWIYVHRLVLLAFKGPCPKGMEACHRNDCTEDNQLENLRWDTKKANGEDRVRNGKGVKGININTAKLTEFNVKQIRRLHSQGYTYSNLGRIFLVTLQNIRSIIRRETWKHVD